MSSTLKDRQVQRIKGQQSRWIQKEVPEVLSYTHEFFNQVVLNIKLNKQKNIL